MAKLDPLSGIRTRIRTSVGSFLPSGFHRPGSLALRLLGSGESAALFAMGSAMLGLLMTPLDLVLQLFERRRLGEAEAPRKPIILVCGPPRSGTTLVEQTLIKHLPVSYFNNLTSVFPRSPITANVLLRRMLGSSRAVSYSSYYGKSTRMSGPNDALYLWDRWAGTDRSRPPAGLTEATAESMRRFFGAFEHHSGKPLVAKNNSLDTYAHLVADVLPTARFICLSRDPAFLAQSLLRARHEIHGNPAIPYGVDDLPSVRNQDPVLDVCRQVRFHLKRREAESTIIGADRFWVVRYEEFCASPHDLVRRVARDFLDQHVQVPTIPPFQAANRVRLDEEEFSRIEEELSDLLPLYRGRPEEVRGTSSPLFPSDVPGDSR